MLSKSAEETKDYFKKQVQPIFEHLIAEIVFNRPQNIEEYAIRYFKKQKKINWEQSDSEDDCDRFEEISQEQFNIGKAMKCQKGARKRRKGVRSQINNYFSNLRQPISLRSAGHKDQKTQTMIRFYFMNSFLFQDFEESDKQFLINSMIGRQTKTDQIIFKEGEFGDSMYFVESGLFECSVLQKDAKNARREIKILRNYQAGDYFGQLCLLHNAKRQATIVSKTEGQLYYLTRDVYNHIRRTSIVIRRQLYMKNLKKVNIFQNLNEQDFEKLCDLLHEVRYEPNDYVIHEGDMGTKFYIVIQGLLASKGSKQQSFYQYYKQGDYFGELALINKKPRQVSVLAITQCRLVSLSSQVFLSVINMEKANNQINNKYKAAKPLPVSRRKKMQVDQSLN